jgi:hypothetical protein
LLIEINAATKTMSTKRDAKRGVPNSLPCCRVATGPASRVELGERWFAVQDQHVLLGASCLRGERVVLVLKPHKLGFKVANTLLETAHLRDHAGIGTADVAE